MDKRANNGGARKGAGRKPKIDELKLIERLDNLIDSDEVIKKMKQLIEDDNYNALKLYMEYRFGKPKEKLDITTNNESLNTDLDYSKLSKETLLEIAGLKQHTDTTKESES